MKKRKNWASFCHFIILIILLYFIFTSYRRLIIFCVIISCSKVAHVDYMVQCINARLDNLLKSVVLMTD